MITKFLIVSSFLLAMVCTGYGQVSVKAQAGLSYIEHLSTGITFSFRQKHNISLLYGSDFFMHYSKVHTLMLQYDFSFNKLKFAGVTPRIGVKGGDEIFSDDYYRWKLFSVVPFLGIQHPINGRLDLLVEGGVNYSFEQSVVRLKPGEIGHYKDILPELKVAIHYQLSKKQK